MLRSSLCIIAVAVVALGCQTRPKWMGGSGKDAPPPSDVAYESPELVEPGLPLAPVPRFKDVPLPAGAKEDTERSYVYESSTLQIGRLVYTTRSLVNEIAQFYIEEAPSHGWKLDRAVQASGTQLYFSKPGKDLFISITDGGITRGRTLEINLTPEQQ